MKKALMIVLVVLAGIVGFFVGGFWYAFNNLPDFDNPLVLETTQFGTWDRYDPINGGFPMFVGAHAHGADNIEIEEQVIGASYRDFSDTDIPRHPQTRSFMLFAKPAKAVAVIFTAYGQQPTKIGDHVIWYRSVTKSVTLVAASPKAPKYTNIPALVVYGPDPQQDANSSGTCTWELTAEVLNQGQASFAIIWSDLGDPFWTDGPTFRITIPKGRTAQPHVSAIPFNDIDSPDAYSSAILNCI